MHILSSFFWCNNGGYQRIQSGQVCTCHCRGICKILTWCYRYFSCASKWSFTNFGYELRNFLWNVSCGGRGPYMIFNTQVLYHLTRYHRPEYALKKDPAISKTWWIQLIITHAPLFRGGEDYVGESPLGDSSFVMNIHNPFMHYVTSQLRDVIMLLHAVTMVTT